MPTRMLFSGSGYSPKHCRSSLRLICRSQLPFISGGTLTDTEPFPITEHRNPADPQSRPWYMPHTLPPPPTLLPHTSLYIQTAEQQQQQQKQKLLLQEVRIILKAQHRVWVC